MTIFGYLSCRILSIVSLPSIVGFKVKISWMFRSVFCCQFIDVSGRINVSVFRTEEYEIVSHPNRHVS